MAEQPAWFKRALDMPLLPLHACPSCGGRILWRVREQGDRWHCLHCESFPEGQAAQVTAVKDVLPTASEAQQACTPDRDLFD